MVDFDLMTWAAHTLHNVFCALYTTQAAKQQKHRYSAITDNIKEQQTMEEKNKHLLHTAKKIRQPTI